ncbi:unnamed protein product [Lymnaea stagnalis]|uniref:4Fe-4S ferredoxin-type domain-containing protein n=1 Tax=Lymnaea stagnalis TaxID=6523 RepID=A0AAV2I2T9_LYMST
MKRTAIKSGKENVSKNAPRRTLGYGRLKEWSSFEDAGQLVLFMSSQKHQIEEFLNQDRIDPDWFLLLVRSITLAVSAGHQQESVKNVLEVLCTTKFLNECCIRSLNELQERKLVEQTKSFVASMIDIMRSVLENLPSQAFKCVVAVVQMENTLRQGDLSDDLSELLRSLQDLNALAKHVHAENEKYSNNQQGRKYDRPRCDEKPPDNFRYLPVLPTTYDLRENANPFIRAACIDSSYEDIDHYLDIQYRLMREDFLIPLRQGISMLRANKGTKRLKSTDLNLWLYQDVKVVGTFFQTGYNHILFIPKLESSEWKHSKRFMFGSMLCLSSDHFQTIVFATVCFTDEDMLKEGKIAVKIQSGQDVIFNNKIDTVYEVAETVTFFEPYFQVLNGLQEIQRLPLQEYIIECKKDIKPPKYLLHSNRVPRYDLSCMMKDQDNESLVPVLTTVKWPAPDVVILNPSQREAAILALTKEMAVIQGPPGTGKTYVGLSVMRILLKNRNIISPGDTSRPILVVCYTNHALDQFLEGVLKFCNNGIVRVGGSSRSDVLRPFHYSALKQKSRDKKDGYSTSVRTSKYECFQEMKEIVEKVNKLDGVMDALEVNIQNEIILKEFMKDKHFDNLLNESHLRKLNGQEIMKRWLNAPNESPEAVLMKSTELGLSQLVLKWPFISEDKARTKDMGIIERASVYQFYLRLVREEIGDKIAVALNEGCDTETQKLVAKYQEMEAKSFQEILPDEHFITLLPHHVLTNIECVLLESNLPAGKKIKFWTLGLSVSLDDQMKDLETLKDVLEDVQKGIYNFKSCDDCEEDDLSTPDSATSDEDDSDVDDDASLFDVPPKRNSVAVRPREIVVRESFLPTLHKAVSLNLDQDDADDQGFVTVNRTKTLSLQKMCRMLSRDPMTEVEEESIEDIWSLNLDRKFSLYNLWVSRYKEKLTDEMELEVERYNAVFKQSQEIDREEMLTILKKANVIGMTTTGAAKHRAVLRALGCKIVVVEEAAEVLESHITTALSDNCQHLILIGDHQQLRPKPTVYELAKNYGLEISLFERFIKNKVPHVVLKAQRRMRPEISKLMRHIYPDLEDDPSVCHYENINGVGKNVFLINHQEQETAVVEGCSKANAHEARYLIELCKYLFKQGYDAEKITILATYSGQVHAIKKLANNTAVRSVRISAVDDFQGEENDIILLSLVRSNEDKNVGFLKVDNRVCVALSRAKKGLYVTGNFDLLASQSKLWTRIVETAQQEKIIGEGLPVVCQSHPESTRSMITPHDFNSYPDGGCGQPCKYRLNCGHSCDRPCHMYDREHNVLLCSKVCSKICQDGHTVTYNCQSDGQCQEPVLKSIPKCGHLEEVPCYKSPESATCSQPCPAVFSCGHQCPGKCGSCQKEDSHPECVVLVEHTWSCGHKSAIPCHQTLTNPQCYVLCEAVLPCGHSCTGTCSSCRKETGHVACKEPCQQVFPCGHTCQGTCSKCHQDAEHQVCNEQCAQIFPCGHRCKEQCYKCHHDSGHQICDELCPQIFPCGHKCSGTCSGCRTDAGHPECKERCRQLLPCGHKCKGVCSSCQNDAVHLACDEHCSRRLPCGHGCKGTCGRPCVPCTQICPNYCRHASCSHLKRTCSQRCLPCQEVCVQKCQHGQSLKRCSGKWETKPCDKACTRQIFRLFPSYPKGNLRCCIHPCSGICSEPCVCPTCEVISPIKTRSTLCNKTDVSRSLDQETTDSRSEQESPKQRLVIKIPSCSHIFYLDELDAYVNMFEPGGTRFIPCPACRKPIMNCLRYDNVNAERRSRREALGAELNKDQGVTADDEARLIRSMEALRKLPFVDEFREICTGVICCREELVALSFKLKCAFVMAEIVFLQGDCNDDVGSALNKLKSKLIETRYLDLEFVVDEVKAEIQRCLKLTAIAKFHSLSLAHRLTLPETLQGQVDHYKKCLNSAKPEPSSLEGATRIIVSLSTFLRSCSLAALADCRQVISVYNQAVKVLAAPRDKMLCDLDLATGAAEFKTPEQKDTMK